MMSPCEVPNCQRVATVKVPKNFDDKTYAWVCAEHWNWFMRRDENPRLRRFLKEQQAIIKSNRGRPNNEGGLFLPIPFSATYLPVPAVFFGVDIGRAGLGLVGNLLSPTGQPGINVMLLLRWVEAAIIASLLVLAELVFTFHVQIAHTWLIATWAPDNPIMVALLSSAVIFVFGVIAAIWKVKQKFTYGITEILFAVLSAFWITPTLWPDGELTKFIALGSALYVASRGVGNLGEAFSDEAKLERLKVTVFGTPTWSPNLSPATPSEIIP